jgi:hypothetical protein
LSSNPEIEKFFLTATAAQIKKQRLNWEYCNSLTLEVAKKMQPEALQTAVDGLSTAAPFFVKEVIKFIDAGLCRQPTQEVYVQGIIRLHEYDKDATLAFLKKYRFLVENDLWLLFQFEGGQELSLAAYDKFSRDGHKWEDILDILSQEGIMPRAKMLKASLEALNRGFIQFRAGWFSRFHERLKPSPAERFELLDDYLSLLASPIPPTVSFALAALNEIDKAKINIEAERLFQHIQPALMAASKSAAQGALAFIEKAAAREPQMRPQALQIAAAALSHQNTDVQKSLLKFMKANQSLIAIDPALKDAIRENLEFISPALQKDFAALADSEAVSDKAVAAKTAGKANISAVAAAESSVQFSSVEYKPGDSLLYHQGEAIATIGDAQTWLESTLAFIEAPFDVVQAERIIQAVALGQVQTLHNINRANKASDTTEKIAKPLIKRLQKLIEQRIKRYDYGAPFWFLTFLLYFLGGADIEGARAYFGKFSKIEDKKDATLDCAEIFRARLLSILLRLDKGQLVDPLKAETTGGFTSIDAIIDSLKKLPAKADFVCAASIQKLQPYLILTRLPWQDHAELLYRLQSEKLKAPLAQELEKALEKFLAVEKKHRHADQWQKEMLVISELEQDKSCPFATLTNAIKRVTYKVETIDQTAFTMPILSAYFFDEGARQCETTVRWGDVPNLSRVGYLRPLAQGLAPLGDRAHYLLTVGLMLSIPELKTLAGDCLIDAIEQHRLQPQLIGQNLGQMLYSEISMPKRAAALLDEVARTSPVHNEAVRQILQFSLDRCQFEASEKSDGDKALPRDLAAILELYLNCSIRANKPVESPICRVFLEDLSGVKKTAANKSKGGKAKELARDLLALT